LIIILIVGFVKEVTQRLF